MPKMFEILPIWQTKFSNSESSILSGTFSLILYNEMNTNYPTLCKLSTSIQPFLGRPLCLTSRTLNLAYFIKTSLNYSLRPRSLKFYFSPIIVYIRVVHFMNYSRITHLWAHRVISLINVCRWLIVSGLNSLILSNQRLTICRSILPCRWSWFSSLMSSINRVTHYLRNQPSISWRRKSRVQFPGSRRSHYSFRTHQCC